MSDILEGENKEISCSTCELFVKERHWDIMLFIHFRDYSEELGNEGNKYQLKESYFINATRMLKIPFGSSKHAFGT